MNIRKKKDHILIDIDGDLRIEHFLSLKNQVDKIMKEGAQWIDFNLEHTNYVDSSNLRFLINIHNHLKKINGGVNLISVTKLVGDILHSTNLDNVFKVFSNEAEYENFVLSASEKEALEFWELTEYSHHPIRAVPLKCPACGSRNVFGHALDPQLRSLVWIKGRYMPSHPRSEEDKDMDFDRVRVAVCSQCFLASIHLSDFIAMRGDEEVNRSRIQSEIGTLISRGLPKRKKIMEMDLLVQEDFFKWPRTDAAVLVSYKLAKECALSIPTDHTGTSDFLLGYLNIMEAENSPAEAEASCFVSARAWLTKVVESSQEYTRERVAEAYYYLVMICLRIQKIKEAKLTCEQFKQFAAKITDESMQKAIAFWLNQAIHICSIANETDK